MACFNCTVLHTNTRLGYDWSRDITYAQHTLRVFLGAGTHSLQTHVEHQVSPRQERKKETSTIDNKRHFFVEAELTLVGASASSIWWDGNKLRKSYILGIFDFKLVQNRWKFWERKRAICFYVIIFYWWIFVTQMHLVFDLFSLIKGDFCFLNFAYYQNTFHVLSSPGVEPTTLCSSAQSPAAWASTTTWTNKCCWAKWPGPVTWSGGQSACVTGTDLWEGCVRCLGAGRSASESMSRSCSSSESSSFTSEWCSCKTDTALRNTDTAYQNVIHKGIWGPV